ncbi:hypothetical protein CEXT_34411, partial [Caerostris extrusa]
ASLCLLCLDLSRAAFPNGEVPGIPLVIVQLLKDWHFRTSEISSDIGLASGFILNKMLCPQKSIQREFSSFHMRRKKCVRIGLNDRLKELSAQEMKS